MGIVVVAEPVLDGGAMRRQLDSSRNGVRRQQVYCLQQRRAAAIELAERAERRREGHAHVHLTLVGHGQQAKGRLEPACRRSRGPRRGSVPGLEQESTASSSPWPAYCSTWWPRSAAAAPRPVSTTAARAWAASRQPAGADS